MNVLVACSQQTQLFRIQRRLQEEGHCVVLARTAEEVRVHVQSRDYDLIVLCLAMRGGLCLLKRLRQVARRAQILTLTAGGNLRQQGRCVAHGANDWLPTPFSLDELVARCRELIRRAHRIADPVLRIYDLEMDTDARAVRRAGQLIRLTRREYALLQLLAFHRGQVMTRTMICERLYGDPELLSSNIVDVLIRLLRGKIDHGFDLPLILTQHGEGYVLRGDEGRNHDDRDFSPRSA
jgi:DNA-binding response OmpR family regulator